MPHAGGLYDQPATFVAAMRFVSNESGRLSAERRKKGEREARRNAARAAVNKGRR